ncbi:hypothetical protein H0A36_15255 [Endozoicomonas sp. SM1973]|uniref:Glutamine amidotransferase type-2 domain-containing protein n=1 Tax=Spartinivicinus marinus TaxID=2994442 RepID=A0A853IBE1_9GAMM|nr:hypothetical protein [Spartinivicinus marinus]MCX4026213.1 hypothetical protein [Spartinivicinus marinus]NYZ67374.1 hypothetical protein [Spartinivicinus marinus]
MCGITALIGSEIEEDIFLQAFSIVKRRGPEYSDYKRTSIGFFGHAQLAFVQEGKNKQPLFEEDSYIIWNGEIYNWQSLNEIYKLCAINDTQLLMRGFINYGEKFLSEIEGQFAFILVKNNTLYIGRDRWGISPLVYAYNSENDLIITSTVESAACIRPTKVYTVMPGSVGKYSNRSFHFSEWFNLSKKRKKSRKFIAPECIMEKVKKQVEIRIPDKPEVLFTTIGGIDSQTVTACVATATQGKFGGAITVVPWSEQDPKNITLGDYNEANATVQLLKQKGLLIRHYVIQLTPEYIINSSSGVAPLDRVLKALGPNLMNVCCGLAEDCVAQCVKEQGGKAIMTAGGPDEAGASYKPWPFYFQQRGFDLNDMFYHLAMQFPYGEGVRPGLVFGEHGLENRTPLVHLIEDFLSIPMSEKLKIYNWHNMQSPAHIEVHDKIAWRNSIRSILPDYSLKKQKNSVAMSTGALDALYYITINDNKYKKERIEFFESVLKEKISNFLNDLKVSLYYKFYEVEMYLLWYYRVCLLGTHFLEKDQSIFSHLDNYIENRKNWPLCYDYTIPNRV